jgi:Coenzyme PQQ synthesis protein D (PqqD)
MLFRKKHSDLSRTDALSARPVRMVEAAMSKDETGGGKLKVTLESPRWAGWLFRMPTAATKTFEFDELGMLVWDSCDGKTSVQQMIRKLAKRYNLNLREAEVATVRFLQMLTKRGLIGLSVSDRFGSKETRGQGDKETRR